MITNESNYYVIEDGGKKTFMPQTSAVFIGDGASTVVRNTASRKNVAVIKNEENPY